MTRANADPHSRLHFATYQESPPPMLAGLGSLKECSWLSAVACRPGNGETFFAEARNDVIEALLTCAGCPVKGECLAFALANDERYGIWGGTTPHQRRRIARTSAQRTREEHCGGDAPSAA